MDNKLTRKFEAFFDITNEAFYLVFVDGIKADDSRELFNVCLRLAEEFETKYGENDFLEQDYLSTVIEFARNGLSNYYTE
jgi:hypothetical protein